jgi:hypothetical protein
MAAGLLCGTAPPGLPDGLPPEGGRLAEPPGFWADDAAGVVAAGGDATGVEVGVLLQAAKLIIKITDIRTIPAYINLLLIVSLFPLSSDNYLQLRNSY